MDKATQAESSGSLRAATPGTAEEVPTRKNSVRLSDPDHGQPRNLSNQKKLRLWAVCIALILALICCGLVRIVVPASTHYLHLTMNISQQDRSIVSVATPAISSEFNSVQDVGWYGSAYLLPMCAFQLPFGKLYAELNRKYIFLVALTIFEVGSIVCAAAPSSVVLILGRAVAGLGGSGLTAGAMIVRTYQDGHLHLDDYEINSSPQVAATYLRPQIPSMFGIVAAVSNLAQAFGLLLGGALTENVSWCKYSSCSYQTNVSRF